MPDSEIEKEGLCTFWQINLHNYKEEQRKWQEK